MTSSQRALNDFFRARPGCDCVNPGNSLLAPEAERDQSIDGVCSRLWIELLEIGRLLLDSNIPGGGLGWCNGYLARSL